MCSLRLRSLPRRASLTASSTVSPRWCWPKGAARNPCLLSRNPDRGLRSLRLQAAGKLQRRAPPSEENKAISRRVYEITSTGNSDRARSSPPTPLASSRLKDAYRYPHLLEGLLYVAGGHPPPSHAPAPGYRDGATLERSRRSTQQAGQVHADRELIDLGRHSLGDARQLCTRGFPTVRAVVLGMLLAHSSPGPQPRSDPKASTKTKEGSSMAMILRLTAVFRSRSYCGDSRVPRELRFRRPQRSPGREHTPKIARPDTTPSAPPAYPSARRCNRPGINAQMPGIFTCYAQ